MSEPTSGSAAAEPTSVDISTAGSTVEHLGTPPEIVDQGGEVSPDVVHSLLEDMTSFYDTDPETGFRIEVGVEGSEDPAEASEGADPPAADGGEEVTGTPEGASSEESQQVQDGEATDGDGSEGDRPTGEAGDEYVPPPVQFRADGSDFTVEGSHITEEGDYVFPKEVFERQVQPHLADRRVWQQERAEFQATIESLNPANNPVVAKAQVMLAKVNELLTDPEKLDAFNADFEKNRDRLVAEAEKAEIQQELDNVRAEKARETAASERDNQADRLTAGIARIVEMAEATPEYAGLDTEYITGVLTDMQDSIFFTASEDMPEHGIAKGDTGVDFDRVARVLDREAKRRQDDVSRAEAKRKNDATRQPGSKKAPAGANKKVTPPAEEKRPTSKREWEAMLRRKHGV